VVQTPADEVLEKAAAIASRGRSVWMFITRPAFSRCRTMPSTFACRSWTES
jgi:hypothetical protein